MTVDVIIPQYGRVDLTDKCWSTVRDHSPDAGIIVVDNGTEDEDRWDAHTWAEPNIQIKDNIGYGRATNVGAAASTADFLLLLNNDCEVHEGWLEPLLKAMDNEKVGAAAGRLVDPDGTLQHAGVRLFWDDNGVLTAANITEEQDASEDVECLAGTALLVRRLAWLSVGGYDPAYVNGYEDVDLTLRLRMAGWQLAYCPDSTVMHHKHASGPSRWTHVNENIARLNEIWGPRMKPADT